METIKLNNGLTCPVIGIGTFMLAPADAQNSVREALKMGYRLIDTANAYVNERAVGRGLRESGVPREEVFLSTKLWPSEYENPDAVDETLARLGVDYVDLLYIHQPAGNWPAGYRQLEQAYREGKARPSVSPTSKGSISRSCRQSGRSYRSSSRWRRIPTSPRTSFASHWTSTASGS